MPGKRPNHSPKGFKLEIKKILDKLAPSVSQFRHLPKVLSKNERFILLGLIIISFGALVSIPISAYYHFTQTKPSVGGSFSEGMVGAPKYINPLLAQTSDVDRDLSQLIYSGLMKYDGNGNLAYDLAESHEISGDGLIYTFKLKDNLKWHDGQSLTSEDIIFTVITAQNSDYGSNLRISWQGVEVSKSDDKTVIFKLKNKYAQFLSSTTLGILPKHLWQTINGTSFGLSNLNIKAVGSGPYKFSKVKRNSSGNIISYEVASFENYYDGQPFISKITFNFYDSEDKMIEAFNNNNIDGMSFVSAEKINSIRFIGKLQLKQLKMPRYFAVFFNQNQSKILADKNIRLALNHATDKNSILQNALSGKGSVVDSPVLPGIINIADITVKFEYDIGKAKKILDEAGWKTAEDGFRVKTTPTPKATKPKTTVVPSAPAPDRLEINLTTSNWPELMTVANQLKEQWEKIGVKINIEILALPELQQAIRDREYQSLLFGEVLGLDLDPFSFWHSSQKKDSGLNLALYDNKEADVILETARETLDLQSRFAKYANFQKIVINDAPVVFLYSPDYIYAIPNSIKNYNTKIITVPSYRFNDINKWYIDTERELIK